MFKYRGIGGRIFKEQKLEVTALKYGLVAVNPEVLKSFRNGVSIITQKDT